MANDPIFSEIHSALSKTLSAPACPLSSDNQEYHDGDNDNNDDDDDGDDDDDDESLLSYFSG